MNHTDEGSDFLLLFNLLFATILLLFSGYICWQALATPIGLAATFWVGAGAFPFIMGILLVFLSVWWIADTLLAMKKERKEINNKEKKSFVAEVFGTKKQILSLMLISAAILIYVFVLIPVFGDVSREYGFVIASFIFLTFSIKAFNKEVSIVKSTIISAVTVVVIFVVFHYGLSVVMPT